MDWGTAQNSFSIEIVLLTTMPLKLYPLVSGLIVASNFALAARAEVPPMMDSTLTAQASTTADLVIPPRFGIDYQTGGGGFRDFGSVDALFPLQQSGEHNLWFVQGQARVDTGGNGGGSVLVGYRTLLPQQSTLLGGYLGLDIQGTDTRTFYQLGAGFERVGRGWDLRSNFYLPVGDRTSNLTLSGAPFFQANQLLLPTTRDVAMAGGDVTVGGEIASLGDLGPLEAYGGLYYYGHPDISGILGGRTGLALAPTDHIDVSLGLQHDGRFGTHVLFQAGLNWGGSPVGNKDSQIQADSLTVALGEPIQRTMPIWIVRDDEIRPAQNPATGEVYGFHHVFPAAAGGDGTIEAPYGDMNQATAVALGGEIIYVRWGSLTSGFTIPDGVQVLSTAVQQPLLTQVGVIVLPESGSGRRPTVPGTVTLGNQTRLSGFAIDAGSQQDGIRGNDIASISLDSNQILTARNGIVLNQVSGDVQIRQNQVQNTVQNGILLNSSGLTLDRVELQQNQVNDAGENGVLVRLADAGQLNTLTLTGNQVEAAGENAIAVLIESNSRLGQVTLNQLRIGRSGENGILLLADSGSIDTITMNGITLGNTGTNGLLMLADDGGRMGDIDASAVEVSQSGANGLLVLADNGGHLRSLNLAQNQVDQATENGIAVLADRGGTVGPTALTENLITRVGGNGLLVQADNGSQVSVVSLTGGRIAAAGQNGALVLANKGSRLDRVTVEQMQIGDTNAVSSVIGSNGILVFADNGGTINSSLVQANQVSGVGATGIQAFADGRAQIVEAQIRNNQLEAISGGGILTFAEGQSQIGQTTIAANTLQDIVAEGIQVFADGEGQIETVTVNNNRVSQTDKSGIQIFAANSGEIDTIQINRNQLNSIGTGNEDGIAVLASTGGQLQTVTIAENQLNQIARSGVSSLATEGGTVDQTIILSNLTEVVGENGLFALADSDSNSRFSTLTLQSNRLQGSGDNAIELGNLGENPFCAVIIDNISIGTSNFDANLFATFRGNLQVVDLPQINRNNGGTFDQVNNSDTTTGTAGTSPCP